jgi:hypothetical protein
MRERLKPFVEQYDAVIFSLREYSKELSPPQVFRMATIDPFSMKNAEISEHDRKERPDRYQIPVDLPIVAQISRYEAPEGQEGRIRILTVEDKILRSNLHGRSSPPRKGSASAVQPLLQTKAEHRKMNSRPKRVELLGKKKNPAFCWVSGSHYP